MDKIVNLIVISPILCSGKSIPKEKKPWGNTNHWYDSVLHQVLNLDEQ